MLKTYLVMMMVITMTLMMTMMFLCYLIATLLKPYIQEEEADLNTLHQTNLRSRLMKYSQGLTWS